MTTDEVIDSVRGELFPDYFQPDAKSDLLLAALFAQSALADLRAGMRDGATMGKCSVALDRLTDAISVEEKAVTRATL